ncbi:hypothetical protein ASF53_13645 [Methylobacterium sp. Leaf123]|nr:hypothetical protein ASF53_13645 [Methylobacterium sp. Leaf123]
MGRLMSGETTSTEGAALLADLLCPGRHIEVFRWKAEAEGKLLPVLINMRLDPAIYIGACFEVPTKIALICCQPSV